MITGRILIVDDFGSMRRIMRTCLRQIGCHEVEEAADGADAMKMLIERPGSYDVVLSDMHMAPINGLELLRLMRHDRRTKNVPFIMVTGDAMMKLVLEAKKEGVEGFLLKPFTLDCLSRTLRRLENRALSDQDNFAWSDSDLDTPAHHHDAACDVPSYSSP